MPATSDCTASPRRRTFVVGRRNRDTTTPSGLRPYVQYQPRVWRISHDELLQPTNLPTALPTTAPEILRRRYLSAFDRTHSHTELGSCIPRPRTQCCIFSLRDLAWLGLAWLGLATTLDPNRTGNGTCFVHYFGPHSSSAATSAHYFSDWLLFPAFPRTAAPYGRLFLDSAL